MTTPQTADDGSGLYRAAIDAVGAKRVARALCLSLSHTYRLQRPAMDEDPNGTGARTDVDRIEALLDTLAAYPDARPVLVQWRLHFDAIFERVLDRREREPLTTTKRLHELGETVREMGEFMEHASANEDPDAVLREGEEAIAAIEDYLRAVKAGAGLDEDDR